MTEKELATVIPSTRVAVPGMIGFVFGRTLAVAIAPVVVVLSRCTVIVAISISLSAVVRAPIVVVASARAAAVASIVVPPFVIRAGARRTLLEIFLLEHGLSLLESPALACFVPVTLTNFTNFVRDCGRCGDEVHNCRGLGCRH